jgi:ligand-binding sensor domain-containing protein
MNKRFACALLLLSVSSSIFAFERFTNYSAAINVNDVAAQGATIWAASSGGLLKLGVDDTIADLFYDVGNFPDLNCTALHPDSLGNLWIGTRRGYVYKRNSAGRHTILDLYATAQPEPWDIRCMTTFGHYLIVGSTHGCSIYDTQRKKAQNATRFGDFNNSIARAVIIYHDTLYVGLDEGFAALCVAGNRLQQVNPYDKSIWQTTRTDSAVSGFIIQGSILKPVFQPTAIIGSQTLVSSGVGIYADTARICTVGSSITMIKADTYGNCWIGTKENYLYRLKNQQLSPISSGGLTLSDINRVFTDKDGSLWCIPRTKLPAPWWLLVNRLVDGRWQHYGPAITTFFGEYGEHDDFHGICQDHKGNMWFGTSGGNVKRFDAVSHEWSMYIVGSGDWEGGFARLLKKNPGDWSPWGKCDAIAQDSSGYLWFGTFLGNTGSMICYDPQFLVPDNTNYRRFFPKGTDDYYVDVYVINVDRTGRIFVGSDDGKLSIITHTGNPIQDSVKVKRFPETYIKILDITTTENNTTWIATSQGLLRYDPVAGELHKIDGFPSTLRCIEAESDTILWFGTESGGLLRYVPVGDTLIPSELTTITVSDGLVSNNINDINIDRTAGVLWIATSDGLARYELGHSFRPIESNKEMVAFPNPFSLTRHNGVTFRRIAPGSQVMIYDIRGGLVCNVSGEKRNIGTSAYEWVVTWRPAPGVVPGTYFFVASQKDDGSVIPKTSSGKLLVVP